MQVIVFAEVVVFTTGLIVLTPEFQNIHYVMIKIYQSSDIKYMYCDRLYLYHQYLLGHLSIKQSQP